MRKMVLYAAVLAVFFVAGVTFAQDTDFIKLENEMWGYARDKDWSKLKAGLSPAYQSMNEHGAIGLQAALDALAKMDLSDFTLSDFKVTQSGPVVVLSYYAEVAETIDGKRVAKRKAPRMSIWLKTEGGWVTIAHANLNPLDK